MLPVGGSEKLMNTHRENSHSAVVYLLRHGDIRQDDIKRYIGQADLSLNDAGSAQAMRWRNELAQVPLSRIFCSDLSRSYETACIIAEGRSAAVQSLHKLREINLGAWDGQPVDDVLRLYPGEHEKRGADLVYYRPPAGECFADIAARVIPLFEEIVRNVPGNVLIVGHAGVNKVLLCHLLGIPMENLLRIRQDYGCLNIIEYSVDSVSLRALNIMPAMSACGVKTGYAVNRPVPPREEFPCSEHQAVSME